MISTAKIKRKEWGTGGGEERKKEAETHIKKFFSKLPIKFLFSFFRCERKGEMRAKGGSVCVGGKTQIRGLATERPTENED